MALDRSDAALIGEEVAKSLKNTGFASGAMSGQQMRDQLTNGIFNVGSSFGKLSMGAYDLKDALNDTAKVFSIFPGVGDVLGGVFTKTIGHLKEMNDSLITSGRFGVTFNQNLFGYTSRLAEAGISFERFNTLLQSANRQIMGLGQNAQQSADFFLATNKALMADPLVLKMNLLGISLTELQDQSAITANIFKLVDRSKMDERGIIETMKQATISATLEIDNMARVTGRSRQEIQKDIDKKMTERDMRLLRAGMDDQQLANLNRANAMLAQLPEKYADLYAQLIVKKGPMTREGAEQIAALDYLSPGLARAFYQMSQAKDAQEQERLRQQFEFLLGRAMANQDRMQREMTNLVGAQGGVAEVVKELIGGARANYGTALAQQFRGAGGDFDRFQEIQQENANLRKAVAAAQLTTNQPGGSGAMVSQILLLLDRALTLGPQAVAKVMQGFETTLGVKLQGLEPEKQVQRLLDLQTNMNEKDVKDIWNELTGSTAVDLNNPENRPNLPRYGETPDRPLNVNVTNTRLNVSTDGQPNLRLNAMPERGRYGGSLNASGTTKMGKWFENFEDGYDLRGHGIESIVRYDQKEAFALDVLRETGILPSLAANLKGAIASSSGDTSRELINAINNLPQQMKLPDVLPESDTEEDKKILAGLLDRLNSKMDKLIGAVEDGSRGTVKAVRNTNNLIG